MKILKFKTNIQNQEMLDKLTPYFDKEELISKWNLDLTSPDKILSVSGDEISPGLITNTIKKIGYEAEMIRIIAIGGHDL